MNAERARRARIIADKYRKQGNTSEAAYWDTRAKYYLRQTNEENNHA